MEGDQLALFRVVTQQPAPTVSAWQSSPDGDRLLSQLREEARLFSEAAKMLGLGCEADPIARWAVEDIWAARAHLESLGKILPSVKQEIRLTSATAKPQKPYRPHSLERKQRSRCVKLLNKHREMYTIGAWWMDRAQEEIALKPWYFGSCSLPDQGTAIAPPYDLWEQQRAFAEREQELRNQA